ncbi:MAG: acyl-CoA dehydrogenase, partial [Acidimicrobiia bacterium]|nr:acyl-CoA dehydrogenase [Acidimicrobiia bacterium]
IENARMTIGMKSAATLSTGYLNALGYAKERHQGADLIQATDKTAPRVPIISHPDVRRMLITQKAYAEGLRALTLYAAWCQEMALIDPDDEGWERRSDFLLPLVKGYSSEKAYELLAMSLQVFGGSGYTQDYPIEQYIRDAKIDTVYEGTTGIQALDLFFRKIARDQGQTVSALAQDIAAFVKGTFDGDPIAAHRETLGRMLDDVQSHLGVMVTEGMAAMAGEPERVYRVGLQANALLESMAELVIAWQLLRQLEVLGERDDAFAIGKRAAVDFFLDDVVPKIRARRDRAAAEDGSLMDLPVEAF